MTKILLIEDDAVMRENIAEILALAHYEVYTAPNGKSGVQAATAIAPDLIVCDIMMPELDGYGVLHILAKDPATACIPFIFLTAKAEMSELRKGMALGADDYLTKPFEDTDLLHVIECRLQKNALIKKEFARTTEGLHQFLDDARGLQALDTLSRKRPVVRYQKKEVIFHEGDTPQHLFFLGAGKIKLQKSHDDGKEYVTSVCGAGDFFGYAPLLDHAPYTDSAVVLETSEVCKIPREDFLALLYKNRDVAARFIRMLSNNVATREQQLLSLAYDTVRKRVAGALLNLEQRYRQTGRAQTRIPMSREDLAGMAGTATETAIRALSELKDEALVAIEGREIVILDLPGLQALMT